eukprot:5241553-Karenia_brevis.AAC.1
MMLNRAIKMNMKRGPRDNAGLRKVIREKVGFWGGSPYNQTVPEPEPVSGNSPHSTSCQRHCGGYSL